MQRNKTEDNKSKIQAIIIRKTVDLSQARRNPSVSSFDWNSEKYKKPASAPALKLSTSLNNFKHDVGFGGVYFFDILENTFLTETEFLPRENYMEKQRELTQNMRRIAIDWLIDVHQRFEMKDNTLFMAISQIDRYLSRQVLRKKQYFQLLAIVSLYLASKYCEIYVPAIDDLVEVCGGAYNGKQVLRFERKLFEKLDFSLNVVTPFFFRSKLEYVFKDFCKSKELLVRSRMVLRFLMEIMLLNYDLCVKFKPSIQSSACAYLTGEIVQGKHFNWKNGFEQLMRVNEKDKKLLIAIDLLRKELGFQFTRRNEDCTSVIRKYSPSSYLKTSFYLKKYVKKMFAQKKFQ